MVDKIDDTNTFPAKSDANASVDRDTEAVALDFNNIKAIFQAHAQGVNTSERKAIFDVGAANDPEAGVFNTFEGARAYLEQEGGGKIEVAASATIPAGGSSNLLDGKIWIGLAKDVASWPPPVAPLLTLADGAFLDNLTRLEGVGLQPSAVGTSKPLRYTKTSWLQMDGGIFSGANAGARPLVDVQAGITLIVSMRGYAQWVNDQGTVATFDTGAFGLLLLADAVVNSDIITGLGSGQLNYLLQPISNEGETQVGLASWTYSGGSSTTAVSDVFRLDGVNDPGNRQYSGFGAAFDALKAEPGGLGLIRYEVAGGTVFPSVFYDCNGVTIEGSRGLPFQKWPIPNFDDGVQWYQPERIARMLIRPGGTLTTDPCVMYNNDLTQGEFEDVEFRQRFPATRMALAIENPGSDPTITLRFKGECLIGNGVDPCVSIAANCTLNMILSGSSRLRPNAVQGSGTLNIIYDGANAGLSSPLQDPLLTVTESGADAGESGATKIPKPLLVGDFGAPALLNGSGTVGTLTALDGATAGAVEDGVSLTVTNPSAGAIVGWPVIGLTTNNDRPPRRLRWRAWFLTTGAPADYDVFLGYKANGGSARFWGWQATVEAGGSSVKSTKVEESENGVVGASWTLPSIDLGSIIEVILDIEWKGDDFTSPPQVVFDVEVFSPSVPGAPSVKSTAKSASNPGAITGVWTGDYFADLWISLIFPTADPGAFDFLLFSRLGPHPKDV